MVLLRGVNVGGHRTFRPAQLAKALPDLDVTNLGAAGTFVVRRPSSAEQVREAFQRRLPFETEIMVVPAADVLRLTSRDPFAGLRGGRDLVRFVSVLARTPSRPPRVPLALPERGRWLLRVLRRDGRFVVGVHRREMAAIRYLGELDRRFGAPATTRGWTTMIAIANAVTGAKPTATKRRASPPPA